MSVSLPYMEGYKKTLTEITRLKSTITPNTGNRCIQNDWKKIEFNNVSYSYPESSNIALKNITIEIEHGKSYGIVGKSGSGKTTLVDLLLCLHTPEDGEILLDGYKLEEYQRNEWYSRIGYVPQFPFIIDDTLIRNIAFGKKYDDIDIERVKHVIDMSGLTDVVHNLPNDVDTILGDDGLRMSGGQRQRIAIARALYDKPDILILDEATSALDTITEREIQRTINLLHGTVTTITIAHRISTVSVCDSIFLLNNGELEAFGDYNNLISSSRLFKKLAGKS
ncbi:MAG TPA: ABC transporter ATP-binding protein [Gammaproteobacteria bacterium]|nr:ABC transporter ATP-binding protein [Gammaproteobacteria bacterium]